MSAAPRDGSQAARFLPSCTRRRRPPPPPTAYRGEPLPSVELPAGYGAQIFPLPSSAGFIGGAFSMDSLEFMRWAALRYDHNRFVLVVLLTLMGSQDPGGLIDVTQAEMAQYLGYSRPHVVGAFKVLEADGALRKVCRGRYQLNPAASLRGGARKQEKGSRRNAKAEKVEQLDLLSMILEDPDAPEAWREMAMPGARLVTRPKPGDKEGAKA